MRKSGNHILGRVVKGLLPFCLFVVLPLAVHAQEDQQGVTLSGSIQSDMMIPENDETIGAEKTGDFLTNTYVDLLLQSKHVDAGLRMEYMEKPLPGYESDFAGWGVPNFWVKGRLGCAELTAGTFYEQFGSGFVLRSYEERSLGIDNSLLGARLVLKPVKGVTIKALGGRQRRYWTWNKSFVSGADMELKEIISQMATLKTTGVEYKIAPADGDFVIGSNSIVSREDLYLDELTTISTDTCRRNKRLFDIGSAFLLLILSPLLLWFQKHKGSYWGHCLQVLCGQSSWVGYRGRKGIFLPSDIARNSTPEVQERLMLRYMRHYKTSTDAAILFKNWNRI